VINERTQNIDQLVKMASFDQDTRGLVEQWQRDHTPADRAYTQDGQLKRCQTIFSLIFPNLSARSFQSHFFKFVFHLQLLSKWSADWSYQLFPVLHYPV